MLQSRRASRIASSSSISISARRCPTSLTIKRAVREAARYYAKLSKLGHELDYLDVGGGLGVDYDGSRTSFDSSTNYSLQEYANDIVYNIMDVCDAEKVPHPNIVSEGGRAIVAHHSVLVVEAFGAIEKDARSTKVEVAAKAITSSLRDILEVQQQLKRGNRHRDACTTRSRSRKRRSRCSSSACSISNRKRRSRALYWQFARADRRLCIAA